MRLAGGSSLGLAGSFVAGLFPWFVLHRHGAGLLLSVLFGMSTWMVLSRQNRRCRESNRALGVALFDVLVDFAHRSTPVAAGSGPTCDSAVNNHPTLGQHGEQDLSPWGP